MNNQIKIGKHTIGEGHPTYIIAEISANHAGDYNRAIEMVRTAKKMGADCVKIQTYTADTITIDSDKEYFQIKKGTWKGENLYKLYQKAYTPWEWQADLKKEAEKIGIDFLSTVYDNTSVDFLEKLGVNAYKIASFEAIDLPLIKYVASKNKPLLLSVGMASLAEIDDVINVFKETTNSNICVLKCSSSYPAIPEEMNIKTINHLKSTYNIPIGLSDHSLGSISSIIAVSLGANVIEKHFCLDRKIITPDSGFSMEPNEFQKMVEDIRVVERALGHISYELMPSEKTNKIFRKSLFVVKEMKKGEKFTPENLRVIRPGHGLPPKYYEILLGKTAKNDIEKGTPVTWELIL